MGIAQTGTGKTAAFVLSILQRMSEDLKVPLPGAPRVLVLAPTRELAAQIDQSFATYGQFLRFSHTAIFGGVRQGPQVRMLPGRRYPRRHTRSAAGPDESGLQGCRILRS